MFKNWKVFSSSLAIGYYYFTISYKRNMKGVHAVFPSIFLDTCDRKIRSLPISGGSYSTWKKLLGYYSLQFWDAISVLHVFFPEKTTHKFQIEENGETPCTWRTQYYHIYITYCQYYATKSELRSSKKSAALCQDSHGHVTSQTPISLSMSYSSCLARA